MNINERAAYIKGLAEGLGVTEEGKEGRVLGEMLTLLTEMAEQLTDLERENGELRDYIEELDEDLGAVEEDLYCGDDCDCDCDDEYEDDDEDDDEEYDDEDDSEYYEVVCPSCGETVCFDESLELDDLVCPACGANEVVKLQGLVKADRLSAGGADDLVILAVVLVIILLIVVLVVVLILVIAITVAIIAAVEILLDRAEILVKLLDIIAKLSVLSLKVGKLLCHFGKERQHFAEHSALLALLGHTETLGKSLNICGSFVNVHIGLLIILFTEGKRAEDPPLFYGKRFSRFRDHALSRYSPVLVSIRRRSPSLIKIGTLITAPVSRVAGFVTLVAVSPRTPGSVSVTFSSTKVGGSTEKTLPFQEEIRHTVFSLTNLKFSPSLSLFSGICS